MTRPRQILYLLFGCLFVVVVLVSMQFTNSTTIVPIVLDLLSLALLIIAVSSLARRWTQSSHVRRRPSQQTGTAVKSRKR
jgi:isoprenylcysteine carboxyl methyltransferase (ICMT) family protein YpbQ